MSNKFRIRGAIENDLLCLQRLMIRTWKATYPNYVREQGESLIQKEINTLFSLNRIRHYITDTHHKLWVIQDSTKSNCMFGFVHLILNKPNADSVFLDQIYLDSEYQGLGAGTMLFNYCKKFISDNNFKDIYLEVDVDNKKAQNFYLKTGFTILKKTIYPTNNGAQYYNYVMGKKLQPENKISKKNVIQCSMLIASIIFLSLSYFYSPPLLFVGLSLIAGSVAISKFSLFSSFKKSEHVEKERANIPSCQFS